MNRRTLLIGSAGALGLAAAGSAALVHNDRYSFVTGLLQRFVGRFQMTQRHERQFVDAVAQRYGAQKFAALIGLYELRAASGLGSAYTNAKLDRFERMLVADFMTATDYFGKRHQANPHVSFVGYRLPCRNPFAKFDQPA